MGLPPIVIPREPVLLPDGKTVEVRGLSRGEALEMAKMDPEDAVAIETHLLAWGTDTALKKAEEWHSKMPTTFVLPVVNKVFELSGMGAEGNGSSGD